MKLFIQQKIKQILIKFPVFYSFLYYIKSIIFNYSERKYSTCYGDENSYKIIYIIRPRTNCIEGFMALIIYVLRHAEYADKNGYKIVVDMLNYKTQYTIDNKTNVWEWFFEQPCGIQLEEAYRSHNVINSGYTFKSYINSKLFSKYIFTDDNIRLSCKHNYCT